MAFIAAGRTRPKVNQSAPARKPGTCNLMEEITAKRSPKTSQIIPLMKRKSNGPRQEASIRAAVMGGSVADETRGAGATADETGVFTRRYSFSAAPPERG